VGAAGFDVRAYSRSAQGSHRTRLSGVGEPIADPLRDLLRYLRRRFAGTTSWLSLVLVTPTHKDARVTAFLSTWAYERHWMGDALVALAGEAPPRPQQPAGLRDRFGPLREAVLANVHGSALTAVQMTERLVDGALVDLLLARAAAVAPAPVTADLDHIRSVLARQQAFFTETAAARLAVSRRARILTRSRLLGRAWPIDAERDPAGTAAALALLQADDPGWAAALDARIDTLPGLRGLGLLRRTAANPGAAVLRTPLRPAAALGRLAASVPGRKG
jgi:hypothetical protein